MKKLILILFFGTLPNVFFCQNSNVNSFLKLETKVGGDIQIHIRHFINDEIYSQNDDLFLRRARLKVSGDYLKSFSFRLLTNFAGNKINLQDAFIQVSLTKHLIIQIGKLKTPLGLEILQSPTNMALIERSLVTNLLPNRDLGVFLIGNLSNILEYKIGITNGIPDGTDGNAETDKNKDYVIYLFFTPFESSDINYLNKLHLGCGYSTGSRKTEITNPLTSIYKSSGRNTFFSFSNDGTLEGTVISAGKKQRIVPQAYLYEGKFGIIAEYCLTKETLQLNNRSNSFLNSAFQTTILYMLTDDKSSFSSIKPTSEFDLSKGTFGAFQIAVRYSELHIDDKIFPLYAHSKYPAKAAVSLGIGLNWIFNQHFKLSINYEKTNYKSGLVNVSLNPEQVILMQTQFVF